MRIVGGEWRGRQLADMGAGDESAHLRPSSDRLRETVFNILNQPKYGFAPRDCHVLDLFSGTGALSFESLSRGARHAVLVDNGATSRRLINENAKRFDCAEKMTTLNADATRLPQAERACDLVFMDPPYSKGLGEKAILSAMAGGWLKQDCVIIWEEALAPALPPALVKIDARKIGRAILTIACLKE